MKKGAGAATRLRKGSRCPTCKAGKLIPIVYGLPGRELVAQYDRGEIELGGCTVRSLYDVERSTFVPCDPELSCPACGSQHFRDPGRTIGDWE